jgi:hypothetical protein
VSLHLSGGYGIPVVDKLFHAKAQFAEEKTHSYFFAFSASLRETISVFKPPGIYGRFGFDRITAKIDESNLQKRMMSSAIGKC